MIEDRNRPDVVEKRTVVKASRARVWRAISDSREFGAWFGMRLEGPFVAGAPIHGAIAPTEVDPEVAKLQEAHAGTKVTLVVVTVEPERVLAFRWHPYAADPDLDYSAEPMTLVTFSLAEVDGGTEVTVTESGFELLPPSRKAEAFPANDGGWTHQLKLVSKYLEQRP